LDKNPKSKEPTTVLGTRKSHPTQIGPYTKIVIESSRCPMQNVVSGVSVDFHVLVNRLLVFRLRHLLLK